MDPLEKMFMFQGWIDDQNEDAELAKNHAYLLGSFWNPEAVKALMGEGANVSRSTDEEFDKSMMMVRQAGKPGKRQHRRVINE
jgi:hypothetical protein